ncbi:unnamed protein product [Albugo candida]|uniref:Uncharacterized protein n=1 Tax=Albugo candida TaxID=65357 RepID=A0A024GGA0_9STRA|nr:unnamed protein product [Albugo candida]|eukprot:CCI45734.1 unnamed protein product [Albugo candida]
MTPNSYTYLQDTYRSISNLGLHKLPIIRNSTVSIWKFLLIARLFRKSEAYLCPVIHGSRYLILFALHIGAIVTRYFHFYDRFQLYPSNCLFGIKAIGENRFTHDVDNSKGHPPSILVSHHAFQVFVASSLYRFHHERFFLKPCRPKNPKISVRELSNLSVGISIDTANCPLIIFPLRLMCLASHISNPKRAVERRILVVHARLY